MRPLHPSPGVIRIAVLFSELSGYVRACLAALRARHGAEVLVIHWPVADEAPFAEADGWADAVYSKRGRTPAELLALLEVFAPKGILMSGWIDRDYLQLARHYRQRGVPVIAGTDTPWRGTIRQRAATLAAPRMLHSAIDTLWVAGDRQRDFARRLGFAGERCLSGFYACDWDRFATAYARRDPAAPPAFLFVGRYHPDKGLDDLLSAYARYRADAADPWPLVCAGAGPLKLHLASVPGVVDLGFVQPDDLPELMARAAAFVLPSRHEPWGVAIQEAAATGLPLLCSTACGATTSLLQDGYNGFLVEPGVPEQLAGQLSRLAALTAAERQSMGDRSHDLSRQFTPDRWADTLVRGIAALRTTP